MKKQLRKLSLAVVFAMAVSLIAPAARVAEAATQKTFTYAEQETGDTVTTLVMTKGEKVDLKFNGVTNWKTYQYKWVSSNNKVAVVDSAGVITAVNTGVATIKLTISGGDGTQYTSTGVTVYVGLDQNITIGTSAKDEIKSMNLELGSVAVLQAKGLKDNVGNRYEVSWSSTDTSVATISDTGVVTPKAPGLTVIQLKVKKLFDGKEMEAAPIALQVTSKNTVTATPTPVPTQKPSATVTVTPTPTVTPIPETEDSGAYSVTVTSDRVLTLKFNNKVSYTASDVELSLIIESGNDTDIPIKQDISSVELDETGKQLTIKTVEKLTTNRYNIKVGSEKQGKTFPVTIGVPNRLEISYSCLGRNNTAYAYDDEVGIDVPVDIVCKLYSGNIDVTDSYIDSGYVQYELISPTNSDDISLEGEQLFFYSPKRTAVIRATYTYYTGSGAEKEITATASIVSKEIGDYTVTQVAKWTIIDDNDNSAIDWNNTVKKVVAGKDNYKIVALLADSYGYYYSTDERGVDKSKNIYSIDDENTLFALKGYTCAFNTSNDDYFYVDDNGDLYTYRAKQNAAAYLTLYNPDEWSGTERNLGAWQFTILEESKLNSVKLEKDVTLLTQASNNEERFCEADILISLYDQYSYKWEGDANLSVSCSISSVNNAIDAVASIDKRSSDGEWVLHVNGAKLYAIANNRKSITLTVTDTDTKKKDSITVQLKTPANTQGVIEVNNWDIGMREDTITFGDGDLSEINASAEVEIYQVSKQGSYNVGLITNGNIDEKGNTNTIMLQTSKTLNLSGAKAGEIYVLVLGPDNQVVSKATTASDLGVWLDDEGKVSVNLASSNGRSLSCMAAGKYTVKVTKINKDGGSAKVLKTTYFTVVDNTKKVTFAGLRGVRTEKGVNGENDVSGASEIILELCNFKLGDASWTGLTENMITNVTYELRNNGGKMYIRSVEFAVPADGKSESGVVTYKKVVNVNKSVTINAD